MNFGSPHESWTCQLRHYEVLERSGLGWEHLGAYRRLVARIAASPLAERLFALRSLDFLVISPTKGWVKEGPKVIDRSRVVLRPCRDGLVNVTFFKKRKGLPEEAETVECPFDVVWHVLEPWLWWLQEEAAEAQRRKDSDSPPNPGGK
jgi:hypothetical protein